MSGRVIVHNIGSADASDVTVGIEASANGATSVEIAHIRLGLLEHSADLIARKTEAVFTWSPQHERTHCGWTSEVHRVIGRSTMATTLPSVALTDPGLDGVASKNSEQISTQTITRFDNTSFVSLTQFGRVRWGVTSICRQ